jgi:hypothetical protein
MVTLVLSVSLRVPPQYPTTSPKWHLLGCLAHLLTLLAHPKVLASIPVERFPVNLNPGSRENPLTPLRHKKQHTSKGSKKRARTEDSESDHSVQERGSSKHRKKRSKRRSPSPSSSESDSDSGSNDESAPSRKPRKGKKSKKDNSDKKKKESNRTRRKELDSVTHSVVEEAALDLRAKLMAEDPFPDEATLGTEVLRAWERAETKLGVHVKPIKGSTDPVSQPWSSFCFTYPYPY